MPEYKYIVTFESDTQPPKTVRGFVKGSLGASARRAIEAAKQQIEGKVHFDSLVVVLEKAPSSQKIDTISPI